MLLPCLHCRFRIGQSRTRVLFGDAGRLQRGAEFAQHYLECRRLLGVPHAVRTRVLQALRHLLELMTLSAADLAGMLHRLLGARNLGADLVVATLYRRERFAMRVVVAPRTLDGRFHGTLFGQGGLQREVALAHYRLARTCLGLDLAEPQGEQLGLQLALFLLQRLVAARGRGLALQVP